MFRYGTSCRALFRNTEVFKSLDPHYYQCSRRTTSTEIETVFQRAINRQHSHDGFSMPIRCGKLNYRTSIIVKKFILPHVVAVIYNYNTAGVECLDTSQSVMFYDCCDIAL